MPYWHYTKGDGFYRGYSSPKEVRYEKSEYMYKTVTDKISTFVIDDTPGLLMDLAASTYTPPGGIMLDPMCGTWRAIIAALQRGRMAFGIEMVPEIAAKTRERIDEYLGCSHQNG